MLVIDYKTRVIDYMFSKLFKKNLKGVETFWYKAAGKDLNHGLKQLFDDIGALEMVDIARCEGHVHLYVLHPVLVLEIGHLLILG